MAWTDRNVGVIEAFRDHLDDKLNERFGYGEILLQIEGMALLKDVFDLSSERGAHGTNPAHSGISVQYSAVLLHERRLTINFKYIKYGQFHLPIPRPPTFRQGVRRERNQRRNDPRRQECTIGLRRRLAEAYRTV